MFELNLEGLTQEQLDSIKKQIEVFEKENEKPKDVIDYENGWIVSSMVAEADKICRYTPLYVTMMHSIGLCRDTEEECEKLIKKMKIEHRLRQWAKMCNDKVDWSDSAQCKYYISFDACDVLCINNQYEVNNNCIYFTDKSILQKAIDDIGEQKLIDEYFVEI